MAAREKAPKRTARSRRLEHIVTLIVGDAVPGVAALAACPGLLGQQAVEELHGDRPEFAEALSQEHDPLFGIVGGMMALEDLPHAGLRARAPADAGRSLPGRSSR